MPRCDWAGPEDIYIDYHDTEWGMPQTDSRALWEALMLEAFQSGLSWITILRKRENFRRAFDGFDPHKIANWGEDDIARLLDDTGIIRHRGKISATITSAQAYQRIEARIGFAKFAWSYVDSAPLQPQRCGLSDVPAKTALSEQLSKDLKKAGFKFCGPTVVYAWMQASGMVNDHVTTCARHAECRALAPAATRALIR
ncbi:DNA-3-methyladenine glycosylase I [Sulfitobacter sp. S190]|uniref:DNA-3-methyladenine glycosylase I n=1 Tax=Sulfitobacter sp. S190 TaxID=2867022 RepID=UPI0021A26E10|nr:DNA-3-methyladenine glycosylase I [Sulfitobacter sp. S190]UWR23108.1 DNA-3-methyladenine glycosylase I [Sulfitobacter sp. S190]